MNRLKLYIFQFGQVVTSLAGIIQKFTCCRLFKQQEWGKEVDAEIQQNQADLKMFVKFKIISSLEKYYFWIELIKENVSGYWGFY